MQAWIKIIFCTLLLSNCAFAQMGPEAGPKTFIGISNLRNNQDRNAAEKVIPTISNNIGLEVGFSYTLQKSIRSGFFLHSYGKTYIDGNAWIQKRVIYRKIPLLFKQITDPRSSRLMISYFIGPQFSMLHDAYHYVENYRSFEEAKANSETVARLRKRPEEYFINYNNLFGVNVSTPMVYRQNNIDLSFGGGIDYPIKSYLMLSVQVKIDWTVLNAELKNRAIFGYNFWTELWGEEGRRRTGSFSIGPTISLLFIPPKF